MRLLKDQSGVTVIEMLAGIIGFIAVTGAVTQILIVAIHNQDRISQRVAADQRARPVLTRVLDGLRSSCVYPRVVPIGTGSTGTSMTFVSRSGSSVTPTPDRRMIALSGTDLTETVYPATGGTPPTWTFSGTPSVPTRTLMTNVTAPSGSIFRYYKYTNGALSSTPLAVPLSAADAALAAYVTVSLSVQPARGVSSQDANSPITLTGSTDLLMESANPVTSQNNAPCT